MPRFYFDVFDALVLRDDEGLEFDTAEAALAEAATAARELAQSEKYKAASGSNHRIEVRDDTGRVIGVVHFDEGTGSAGRK